MARIDVGDIQGIILRGYGDLQASCFVMLRIDDAAKARRWIKGLIGPPVAGEPTTRRIKRAAEEVGDHAVNVAFTHDGLRILGLDSGLLEEFDASFRGGMARNSIALGDCKECDPGNWSWGGPQNAPVHALLLLYAKDDAALRALYEQHVGWAEGGGLVEVEKLDGGFLSGRKEHFGFRDGIGQPYVDNDNPPAERMGVLDIKPGVDPANVIAAGEFLLGYRNEEELIPPGPFMDGRAAGAAVLPAAESDPDRADLGRNGSYLVFRQLAQDVQAFWHFIEENAAAYDSRVQLAAKMVGRWPNGAPLVTHESMPDLSVDNDDDDFLYEPTRDLKGHMCPIGAHIRRANPRDALDTDTDDPKTSKSLAETRRRRLIRRGRPYGEPVVESMDAAKIIGSPPDDVARGLLFLCFNANIREQFDFVQQTWINDPSFRSLNAAKDPVIGDNDGGDDATFAIQSSVVPRVYTGLKRFVTVKGGAYFFMPGMRALEYLANLGA